VLFQERRKKENQGQYHIKNKLKIQRKEANNLENKTTFSLQGKLSNFDRGL
jgi:hypothetical protein